MVAFGEPSPGGVRPNQSPHRKSPTNVLGVQFIKVQPTTYILQYKSGRVTREGAGLAFFYYAPTSSLVAVPIGGTDAPFIFNEVTADFQEVTIQGQAIYRITDPKRIAGLLNFTLDPSGKTYVSDDPQKLPLRVVGAIQVIVRRELQKLPLRAALKSSDALGQAVTVGVTRAPEIVSLGVEILGLSILAIKPTPETARALEAEAREQILREADEAVYARRNAAIQQERAVKENELNTEIAVENKRRQIREAQMEAERAVQEKNHQLKEADILFHIAQEEKNKSLVARQAENAKTEADVKAYAVRSVMNALAGVDARTLQTLANMGMRPEQLVAAAFQELAERADKIGQLNISPDLLRELLGEERRRA
jgi:hypothetical protein